MQAAVDSGAVDHVWPEEMLTDIPLEESMLSKAKKGYVSAASQTIPNKGQRRLICRTREGHKRGICVQVAPVRKPLISSARLNETGNDVLLTRSRPRIINLKTKEVTMLRRIGRTIVLDLWVWVPAKAKPPDANTSPFGGR